MCSKDFFYFDLFNWKLIAQFSDVPNSLGSDQSHDKVRGGHVYPL